MAIARQQLDFRAMARRHDQDHARSHAPANKVMNDKIDKLSNGGVTGREVCEAMDGLDPKVLFTAEWRGVTAVRR